MHGNGDAGDRRDDDVAAGSTAGIGGPVGATDATADRSPAERMTAPPWLGAGEVPTTPESRAPAGPTDSPHRTGAKPAAVDTPAGRRPSRIVLGRRRDNAPSPSPAAGDGEPVTADEDDLGRLALGAEVAGPSVDPVRSADGAPGVLGRQETPGRVDPAEPGRAGPGNRTVAATVLALGGLMVVLTSGVLGYRVAAGGGVPSGSGAASDTVAPMSGTTAGGTPAPGAGPVSPVPACPVVIEPDHLVGDGPGSLDHPAGVVLAFNHAYYVERSVERAFQAVAPSSPLDRGVLFRDGVARLAPGTAHCVDARVVDDRTVAAVVTEYPPGAGPVVFHQRIRVERLAGDRWGIVTIDPAG